MKYIELLHQTPSLGVLGLLSVLAVIISLVYAFDALVNFLADLLNKDARS